MSKNNYSDLVALLEWAEKKNQPVKVPRWLKKPTKEPDLNVIDLLNKKMQEVDVIKTFLSNQEKINKKDEKKEEKKWHEKMSNFHLAVFLTLSSPIIFGLYGMFFLSVIRYAKGVMQ